MIQAEDEIASKHKDLEVGTCQRSLRLGMMAAQATAVAVKVGRKLAERGRSSCYLAVGLRGDYHNLGKN